ncbi:MAG: hypothetical protein K8S15_11860 [Candidatus Aegiribacteria sp.]|nr:hypothetical protein [Candidatus Aegiribacteria sp.]
MVPDKSEPYFTTNSYGHLILNGLDGIQPVNTYNLNDLTGDRPVVGFDPIL